MFSSLTTAALIAGSLLGVVAALPSTTNYQLNSYGFGSGGTSNSSTSNYSLEGITGEASSQTATTSTYNLKPGYVETQQANVPKITLSNPSNYYDKLHFVIDQQNNPSDAKYALQICVGADWTPSCGGTTMYVKSDNTLGATLNTTDYQTYATWTASGGNIIGLSPSTNYYIRARATQGQFTESAYGPSSSAATSGQSISFCLYTNANCAAGGNTVAFGGLLASTVNTPPNNSGSFAIGIDFATNANYGGNVYILSANGGLKSNTVSYTINSSTTDLGSASEGYGAQVASVTPGSGGPFGKMPPYDGPTNNVGGLTTTYATIFSAATPVSGGSGTIQLKAKPSSSTPAANDYSDTVTVVAAASF